MTEKEQFEHFEKISFENIKTNKDIHLNTVKTLNSIIFTIGAGTFAVSISFMGYLKVAPEHPWVLIWSWIFFFATICGNVVVHVLSSFIAVRLIKELNDHRKNNFMPPWDMRTTRDDKTKSMQKWANGLSIFVFSCLFIGIVFLMVFTGINLLSQHPTSPDPIYCSNYTH